MGRGPLMLWDALAVYIVPLSHSVLTSHCRLLYTKLEKFLTLLKIMLARQFLLHALKIGSLGLYLTIVSSLPTILRPF